MPVVFNLLENNVLIKIIFMIASGAVIWYPKPQSRQNLNTDNRVSGILYTWYAILTYENKSGTLWLITEPESHDYRYSISFVTAVAFSTLHWVSVLSKTQWKSTHKCISCHSKEIQTLTRIVCPCTITFTSKFIALTLSSIQILYVRMSEISWYWFR